MSKYWLYGKHSVIAAINNTKRNIYKFLCSDNNFQIDGINIQYLPNKDITNIIGTDYHQGFALLTEQIPQPNLDQFLNNINSNSTIIILDHVTNIQNIGAIIRSAVAFKVDAIILTKDNMPSDESHIVKAASGYFENINIITVTNLVNTIKQLKKNDFWVFALDAKADLHITDIKDTYNKKALVLGSEDKGIRKLVLSESDIKISIPITINSINVSNAAAIALYHFNLINSYKSLFK